MHPEYMKYLSLSKFFSFSLGGEENPVAPAPAVETNTANDPDLEKKVQKAEDDIVQVIITMLLNLPRMKIASKIYYTKVRLCIQASSQSFCTGSSKCISLISLILKEG